MANITNLTNTKWYFNETLDHYNIGDLILYQYGSDYVFVRENRFKINFIYAHEQYTSLSYTFYPDSPKSSTVYANSTKIWAGGGWSNANENYHIMTITGGDDVTDPDLIAWLEANATIAFTSFDLSTLDLPADVQHTICVGLSAKGYKNSAPSQEVIYRSQQSVAESGEILDSWEEIIANVNNGTYAAKYSTGNYKSLDLGSEGIVNMQIAAIDADVLSDGSGNAHITWIAKELLNTKHSMNSTNTIEGGWKESGLRAYLANDVYTLIPAVVQQAIVAVDKTYRIRTEPTCTVSDKLWIPSRREIDGTDKWAEESDLTYDALFPANDRESRVKKHKGTVSSWWLRTTMSSSSVIAWQALTNGGTFAGDYPTTTDGIALGFCF